MCDSILNQSWHRRCSVLVEHSKHEVCFCIFRRQHRTNCKWVIKSSVFLSYEYFNVYFKVQHVDSRPEANAKANANVNALVNLSPDANSIESHQARQVRYLSKRILNRMSSQSEGTTYKILHRKKRKKSKKKGCKKKKSLKKRCRKRKKRRRRMRGRRKCCKPSDPPTTTQPAPAVSVAQAMVGAFGSAPNAVTGKALLYRNIFEKCNDVMLSIHSKRDECQWDGLVFTRANIWWINLPVNLLNGISKPGDIFVYF